MRRRRILAVVGLIAAVCAVAATVFSLSLTSSGEGPQPRAEVPGSTPIPRGDEPDPTATSTTPGPEPAFPTTDCRPVAVAADGFVGLGVPRPARIDATPPERTAFDAAYLCLKAMTGKAPVLRTQFPIDVTRRVAPGGDELAEVTAFGALLARTESPGIVSVRAHDFTRCGRDGAPKATERTSLAAGEALQPCEYPSVELFAQLFTELRDAVVAASPATADLRYTAWNEPDHPTFTLLDAFGQAGAARRAGQYWSKAAAIAGADRVLAGEFADRDLPTLLALRDAFVDGTGGTAPPSWAIHPYRDLTASAARHVTDGFEAAVAPASVWLTEVNARLTGRENISGKPGAQRARGGTLRARLARTPTRVVLYLLTPPPAPQDENQDGWDSALADRSGRARPFLCGLAALPATRCPGNPVQFGG